MDYSGLFPIVFMVAVVAIMLYVHYVLAEQRRRQWRRVAAALGCELRHSSAAPWTGLLGWLFADASPVAACPHPLFQRGHSRLAPNLMTGQYADHALTCFDYQYTVGGGKNSHTYYFLCVVMSSRVPFRRLCVRPESAGDKVLGFLGAGDIQFESDEFNRRFHVECEQPRFAFDVLHPRAMELLLGTQGICLEAMDAEVLYYMSRASEGAGGLERCVRRLLQFGADFLALVPEYLTKPQDRH